MQSNLVVSRRFLIQHNTDKYYRQIFMYSSILAKIADEHEISEVGVTLARTGTRQAQFPALCFDL